MNNSQKDHVLKELNQREVYNLFKSIYEISDFNESSMEKEANALLGIFIQNDMSDCTIKKVKKNDIKFRFSLTENTYLFKYRKDHYELDKNTYSTYLIDQVIMNYDPERHHKVIELGWYLDNRLCYSFIVNLIVDTTYKPKPKFKIKTKSLLFSKSYLENSFFTHFIFLVDSLIPNQKFMILSEENRDVIRRIMCYYTGTEIATLTEETLLSYRNLMEMLHE